MICTMLSITLVYITLLTIQICSTEANPAKSTTKNIRTRTTTEKQN